MKIRTDWQTAAFMPDIATAVFVLLSAKVMLPDNRESSRPLSRGAAATAAANPVQAKTLPRKEQEAGGKKSEQCRRKQSVSCCQVFSILKDMKYCS